MSNDKLREEFEREYICDFLDSTARVGAANLERGSDGEYRSYSAKGAWWAWQASREALVIEMPEERKARGYGEQVADALGFNDGISYCREAIEAAGLRCN